MVAKTILLVDDEFLIQMLAREVLEQAGYMTIAAYDGLQALTALSTAIDLIVTDVMMPRMDGPEWVRHARERGYTEVPVIFASALAPSSIADEFGNAAFLRKPYEPERLLACVAEMLGEPAHVH